jgi:hypothetical protein
MQLLWSTSKRSEAGWAVLCTVRTPRAKWAVSFQILHTGGP